METVGPAPLPSLALRRAYRKAGPQTWALIRELYLAGVPAAEVSAQFDVSVHTVRKRATREGWSRRAQAAATPDLRLPPGGSFAAIPAASGAEAPVGEGGAAEEGSRRPQLCHPGRSAAESRDPGPRSQPISWVPDRLRLPG